MREAGQKEQVISMMKRPIPKKKVGIIKLKMIREGRALYGTDRFHSAREAAEMIRSVFEYSDREILAVMSLDTTLTPIALEIAAVGGLCSCTVDNRDIFKHAILSNAAKIICFHNHPSGNVEASREDIHTTEQIKAAGDLLGIELIDHIIVAPNGIYLSFRESGISPFEHNRGAA